MPVSMALTVAPMVPVPAGTAASKSRAAMGVSGQLCVSTTSDVIEVPAIVNSIVNREGVAPDPIRFDWLPGALIKS